MEELNMHEEEKFNIIYQKIVDEETENMEAERAEAKRENVHNILILIIIVLINILISIGIYKLIDKFSFEIVGAIFTVSMAIFAVIKHRGGKSKIERYANEFKVKVVGKIIKFLNEGLDFSPSERSGFRSI